MKLSAHIANRFLTDDTLVIEMVTTHRRCHPNSNNLQIEELQYFLSRYGSKNYIVAETVMDKLERIKIKSDLNYAVFASIADMKETYVLPNNEVLRVNKIGDLFHFVFMKYYPNKEADRNFHFHIWWADITTGKTSINVFSNGEEVEFRGVKLTGKFDIPAVKYAEQLAYTLLAFCKLQEVTEVVIAPGSSTGTRKSGKILNDSKVPLIIIDSNWTVTSIRNEGFDVSGHFAIRWTGEGRTNAKLVFIAPFRKHGYIRKAKTDNQ